MGRQAAVTAIRGIALAVGAVCTISAGIMVAQQQLVTTAYQNLSKAFTSQADEPVSNGIAETRATSPGDTVPPNCIAWLEVAGTSISYPVMQLTDDHPDDWYLDHDAWGEQDAMGCPYLDRRSKPDGQHLMVYGHHIQGTSYMFSELADAYTEESFGDIGYATLTTADGTSAIFVPYCAMRVDASYLDIQKFSFSGERWLGAWLVGLSSDADVKSERYTSIYIHPKRVLTLVTCSSEQAGQPWRTLAVFVEVDTESA